MQVVPLAAEAQQLRQNGYIEYQYRQLDFENAAGNSVHLATWRNDVVTYLWRPWILQLNGSLGLTASQSARADSKQEGELVTGALVANLFPRSPFPFRAFIDSRDSRVDSDISNLNLNTLSYGFLQQLAPRGGGRMALEYRHTDSKELFTSESRVPRNYISDSWQLTANKTLGRNDFRLMTASRSVDRHDSADSEDRKMLSLRHRFRIGPRFFIEDTTFYSDERLRLDRMDLNRRFMQFSAITSWRPVSEKPFLFTGRALLQGTDSGADDEMNGAAAGIVTMAATYQWSPQLTLSGNIGVARNERDTIEPQSRFFQRLRTTYRAQDVSLLGAAYRWSATSEVGNRSESDLPEPIMDLGVSFEHGLMYTLFAGDDYQLQVNFSQQLSGFHTTDNGDEHSIRNAAFATLSHRGERSTSYVRLSASNRRLYGRRDLRFQLANLQLSTRTRISRTRSFNGSVTLQFSRNDSEFGLFGPADNRSTSYSANIGFSQRNMFEVQRLNFLSELRWLSSDFHSEDPFDRSLAADPERENQVWRNRLDYRVGRLELRLTADVRELNGSNSTQLFLQLRRYYGDL